MTTDGHIISRRVVRVVLRLSIFLIGVLFLVAALSKAIDDTDFTAAVLYQVGFLSWSESGIGWITTTVIVTEVLVGAALVTGWINRWSMTATIGLVVLFSILLVRMLLDSSAPPACGCLQLGSNDGLFGGSAEIALGRNAVILTILGLNVAYANKLKVPSDRTIEPLTEPRGGAE